MVGILAILHIVDTKEARVKWRSMEGLPSVGAQRSTGGHRRRCGECYTLGQRSIETGGGRKRVQGLQV